MLNLLMAILKWLTNVWRTATLIWFTFVRWCWISSNTCSQLLWINLSSFSLADSQDCDMYTVAKVEYERNFKPFYSLINIKAHDLPWRKRTTSEWIKEMQIQQPFLSEAEIFSMTVFSTIGSIYKTKQTIPNTRRLGLFPLLGIR